MEIYFPSRYQFNKGYRIMFRHTRRHICQKVGAHYWIPDLIYKIVEIRLFWKAPEVYTRQVIKELEDV